MIMRRNPLGFPVEQPAVRKKAAPARPQLVRVGTRGVHTHIYDPDHEVMCGGVVIQVGAPICESGFRSPAGEKNRGIPELYFSGVRKMGGEANRTANYVTCYRCIKLAKMNLARWGSFIEKKR